ncbi:hypothetical protein DOTSEDRAFT_44107 [Dothistroma septosporum NZE10]|uniref:Uncharacterized protein n=1 Tax=Dothistroma septosporum (strain NZE10 / CBS 128990) TaxID=675120 RepID=N1PR57_DOTSN|nr:hypothetical protein DOTSEDRAFT_44107 [Dothistroma septosporum NZE10]
MSLTELIKFVYEQELACTTLQGTDCEFVLSEAYITLLAFDRRILDGLINGNLPALYAQAGSEEAMIEERLRDRASTSGHIAYYMNTIMDKNNRSVVWRHLNAVVGDVLLYMQQDSASSCIRSFLVDQEFSQKVRQIGHYREGFRKFLYDKDDPHSGHFVPRREQACVAFAKYLRIASTDYRAR